MKELVKIDNAVDLKNERVDVLASHIQDLVQSAKVKVARDINTTIVQTYWEIGRYIVEFEQAGNISAEYGTSLLTVLVKRLTAQIGAGFSRPNLNRMRQFYLVYPKFQTVSGKCDSVICSTVLNKLSWSHICELIAIEDDTERQFYENCCAAENWSVRDLKRQKDAGLFLRLAASKDKQGILQLAQQGMNYAKPEDVVKDTYTLEFLGITPQERYSERDLETAILNNLTKFLLELGKGFTFQARQYPITINNEHYYIDLVFYHKKLRCPVC